MIPAHSDNFLLDGTTIESLVDAETHEVSARVLSDAAIYQLELERIFARVWVPVAHESELPEPGSYVTRHIGADSVIVSRAADGDIRIMLNVCSHRGMEICRADRGSAKTFRCPYHGWIFGNDGQLRGIPYENEVYGDSVDKSAYTLRQARVGVFCGVIFGNWDPAAPSLEEYLGDYAWYLKTVLGRTDGGMQVLGPPQRWRVPGNWKMAAEQLAGDSNHGMSLHQSTVELGLFGAGEASLEMTGQYGINVTDKGHGMGARDLSASFAVVSEQLGGRALTVDEKLAMIPPPGLTPDLVEQAKKRLTPGQLRFLADTPPSFMNVFPNLAIICFGVPMPDGQLSAMFSIRIWQPKGPNEFEVINFVLAEKEAPEALKLRMAGTMPRLFGVSGLFEQDDTVAWAGVQRSVQGVIGRQSTLKYKALTGESRPDDLEGGGFVTSGLARDDNEWYFWLRWRELMTGGKV